jgi:3',5'-cyclic AMP phosphodiesterase CpdA
MLDTHRITIAAAAMLLACQATAVAQQPEPIGILLAAGDISTCLEKGKKDEAWYRFADRTGALIADEINKAKQASPPIPIRVLALGDLAYGDGSDEQFECFRARWKDVDFDKDMLPVPGNHDYRTRDAVPYYKFFKNNEALKQKPGLGYFTVNFPNETGPWRLVGLNSEFSNRWTKTKSEQQKAAGQNKEQLKWLATAIDASKPATSQACVLAFWHQPTFTSGRHGHEDYKNTKPGAELSKELTMQKAFRILYDHGATAVLAGHEHSYEQFTPQDADGNFKADGVRLFVVGTGGAGLTEDFYTKMEANSEGIFGNSNGVQGVLKIKLYPKRYTWEFLSIDPNKSIKPKTKEADCVARKKPPA